MLHHLWGMLQGLVEYGALSGGEVAGGTGASRLTTWIADNKVTVAAVAAGCALLLLVRGARHR